MQSLEQFFKYLADIIMSLEKYLHTTAYNCIQKFPPSMLRLQSSVISPWVDLYQLSKTML